MDTFYEYTGATMGGHGVDRCGRARPSTLLFHLQEAAVGASDALLISRETMLVRHNVFWMLARIWFRLERPIAWDEPLLIRTWHRGGRGVTTYRDYDIYAGGELAGEAVSSWVLADWDTKKLLRMTNVPEFADTTGGSLCKDRALHKLQMPEGLAPAEQRLLRDSDGDINGHVNNARYADFACDALGTERLPPEQFVSELQLGYVAECRPGEMLDISTAWADGAAFAQGMGPDGRSRFEARVQIAERSR